MITLTKSKKREDEVDFMKIYAFEVREDERASFAKYEKEFGVKITCTDLPLYR